MFRERTTERGLAGLLQPASAFLVILMLLVGPAVPSFSEIVRKPPFDGCEEFSDDPGEANADAGCLSGHGGVAAYANAWTGAAAGKAWQYFWVPVDDTSQDTPIRVDVQMVAAHGAASGGAAFSGTYSVMRIGDVAIRKTVDEWLDQWIAAEKIYSILSPLIPGSVGTMAAIILATKDAIDTYVMYEAYHEAEQSGEAEILSIHDYYTIPAGEPGVYVYGGVRAQASGALFGKSSAVIAGVVTQIIVSGVDPPGAVAVAGPDSLLQFQNGAWDVSVVGGNNENVQYVIDWGDGGSEEETGFYTGNDTIQITHQYNTYGSFHIVVMAEERDGLQSTVAVSHRVDVVDAEPDVITGLVASIGTHCDSVYLVWNPDDVAEWYSVWRAGPEIKLADDIVDTRWIDTGGVPGAANGRSYFVKGENRYFPDGGTPSANVHGHKKDAPAEPYNISAQYDTCAIILQWNGHPEGDGDKNQTDFYTVLRGTDNSVNNAIEIATIPGTCSSCVLRHAPTATDLYYFWVRATNECGSRMGDADSTVLWLSNPGPTPPADVLATDQLENPQCDFVRVTWTSNPPYKHYVLRDDAIVSPGLDQITVSWDDFGADPGVEHSYAVMAYDPVCNVYSLPSATDLGWADSEALAPDVVEVSDGTVCDSVLISWSPAIRADTYDIYRESVWIAAALDTFWYDATIPPGTTMTYTVEAKNLSCPDVVGSASDDGFAGFTVTPPVVVIASDEEYCDFVYVHWPPVVGAKSYNVWRNGVHIYEVGDTIFIDVTEPGFDHNYQIQTKSTCMVSALSLPDSGSAGYSVDPPLVSATDGTDCQKVHVQWNDIEGSLYYSLYRDGSVLAPLMTETFYDDWGAQGDTHTYWVDVTSTCMTSEPSDTVLGWIGYEVGPPVVVDAANEEWGYAVRVVWNEVPHAVSYSVYRDSARIDSLTTADTTYYDVSATKGISYLYQIESHSTCTTSPLSVSDDGSVVYPPQPMSEPEHADLPPGGTTVLAEYDFDGGDGEGWVTVDQSGRGSYGMLHEATGVALEDDCYSNGTYLWGFFDDPGITNYDCHVPTSLPSQGAVSYEEFGLYIKNEIWSPPISLTGNGNEFFLSFLTYRDLPLENLVAYGWRVRSGHDGTPPLWGEWRDRDLVYYGLHTDWHRSMYSIGDLIEPGSDVMQVSLAVYDMFPVWSGIFGDGSCHSHAPLFDEVKVVRVDGTVGPQWHVRHIDLFQDNFAEDGTLTGHARADMAQDITSRLRPMWVPGDSVCVTVNDPVEGLGQDTHTGVGPAVYAYVALLPQGQMGKSGPDLEAPELGSSGLRYPYVSSYTDGSVEWFCFRLDTVKDVHGDMVPDRYCFDLNDEVFTPGDTICYVFGALNTNSYGSYWSREYQGQGTGFTTDDRLMAFGSPCEFTILPAGGWERGGDILYVDVADDRVSPTEGPVQFSFDDALTQLGVLDLVDRYDVLGPTSIVNNSLASRVKDFTVQISSCYRRIIWSTADLTHGTIGDGTGVPVKSDDFGLLHAFLSGPQVPGLYLTGDNIAEEWAALSGLNSTNVRSTFMNFDLFNGNHMHEGELESPSLVTVDTVFFFEGAADNLSADGGCPMIDEFDLMYQTGMSVVSLESGPGVNYVLRQDTYDEGQDLWARVVLSGFSFHHIEDLTQANPPANVRHLERVLRFFNFATGIEPTPQPMTFLGNSYPNPFNASVTIRYGVKERAHVSLKIYNVSGQLVHTIVNDIRNPGVEYAVRWSGQNNAGNSVATGVYFYRLVTKNFSQSKKMVLLK